jgi:hypothetical protein
MRLGDRKFFNLFARLASETNPDHDVVEWKVAGANWRRQRHVYWSQISFQVETHEIRCVTRPSWAFILVHEIWWGEDRRKVIRNAQWTHLQHGARRDVLSWFGERERDLDNGM